VSLSDRTAAVAATGRDANADAAAGGDHRRRRRNENEVRRY